jgi:hypothetical protein
MAEVLQIPETRFITDTEREELLALYTECQALLQKRKDVANKELTQEPLVKHA